MISSLTAQPAPFRARRSVLYVPGSNARAVAKTRTVPVDCVIFDWEDAVAPASKERARLVVMEELEAGGFGHRERIVRINPLDSPWGGTDLQTLAECPPDVIALPKVAHRDDILRFLDALDSAGVGDETTLWIMAETPRAILDLDGIVSNQPRLGAIVVGTEDLSTAMRTPPDPTRLGLLGALYQCVLVARAHGLDVLDGVFTDLEDETGFRRHCEQGRALGFDGKTLIHPKQAPIADSVFGVNEEQAASARRVISGWQEAVSRGDGIAVVDGRMIEQLHVDQAQRMLMLYQATTRDEA